MVFLPEKFVHKVFVATRTNNYKIYHLISKEISGKPEGKCVKTQKILKIVQARLRVGQIQQEALFPASSHSFTLILRLLAS